MTDTAARSSKPDARSEYLLGLLLIALCNVCFSLGGLFMRLLETDVWSALFWRGIFCGLTVLAWLTAREGTASLLRLNRIGWPGVLVILSSSIAMICYLTSLRTTTVANNAIIFGTMPFMIAGMAWLMIGERASRATLFFSAFAFAGVVIVMSGSLGGIHLVGDALSVAMTVLNGLMIVLLRQHRALSLFLAVALSAFATSVMVAPLAAPVTVAPTDLAILALFGATQGVALICMTIGGRMLPAADAGLTATLGVPFAPFWVWLALGELPSKAGMIGGAIVLTALLAHALYETRAASGTRMET